MAIPLLRFFFRTAKKGTKPPFTVLCPVELPERFPPLWEVAPSVVGRCRPAFSERRPKPVLLPGCFCVPLRHRLSDLSHAQADFYGQPLDFRQQESPRAVPALHLQAHPRHLLIDAQDDRRADEARTSFGSRGRDQGVIDRTTFRRLPKCRLRRFGPGTGGR